MKKGSGNLVSEYRTYKACFFIAIASLLILYAVNLFLDVESAFKLNDEDGFIESFTAISFFLTAVIFLILFIRTRAVILLFFVLAFIFGAGEEISWGQRLIGFETPESIESVNAQREFNLHNLNVFNSVDEEGHKQGISRFFGFNTLFFLFCMAYGILLPLMMKIGFVRNIVERIKLPVPPLILGVFFLINYLLFKALSVFNVVEGSSIQFSSVIDESKELGWAIVFLLIAIAFLKDIGKSREAEA
jgi:hypothetical protein